jgi:ElaB/YqjD/DUF883 family membrane-anchored ribosome-binding protein
MTTDSEHAARLEQEIVQTRANIDMTLDAIQERLSPGRLVDRALEYTRENGGAFAGNLGRSVRDNPMPVALLGIGIGWLMLAGNRSTGPNGEYGGEPNYGFPSAGSEERLEEGASSIVHAGKEEAHEWADTARRLAGATGSRVQAVREGTAEAAARMKHQAQRAKTSVGTFIEENPLAIGALAVAAGAVIGALIPTTTREREVLGPAADRVRESIGNEVREMTEAAKRGTESVAGESRPGAPGAEERAFGARSDRPSAPASGDEPVPATGPIDAN